ncbi:MAG: HAD family hydrolase [Candidatus Coproplasma sp.]
MYKAIIFDLDGTLLNTSLDIHSVLNSALSHFSLPEISLEKTVEYVGNGARKLVERAIPEDKTDMLDEVYAYYAEHFAACDNEQTCLYDGEEKFLLRIKACGIKTAIITNKPQAATEGVYNKHLARFSFDKVLGHTESYPLKPEPDSTLAVMAEFGVEPGDCLFVGDGETDVLTAKNAGIKCASVLWGYRSYEKLRNAGAETFITDFDELDKFVFEK